MLIVSKFHDYYDTASIYGVDKTCVYKREEERVPMKWETYNREYSLKTPDENYIKLPKFPTYEEKVQTNDATYIFDKHLLGFCGKIYPFVRVEKTVRSAFDSVTSEEYFFSRELFAEYMEQEQIEVNSRKARYWSYYSDFSVKSEAGLSSFFDQTNWRKLEEIFVAFRVPTFIVGYKNVILNPVLKKIGFMKMKDPVSAFQDIYMYMSGVLGAPPKPTKPIDDKIMAASKGHDGPYSFKKTPGKKSRWR